MIWHLRAFVPFCPRQKIGNAICAFILSIKFYCISTGYVLTDLIRNQLDATAKARGIPKVGLFERFVTVGLRPTLKSKRSSPVLGGGSWSRRFDLEVNDER